jgi:hypothetical protein
MPTGTRLWRSSTDKINPFFPNPGETQVLQIKKPRYICNGIDKVIGHDIRILQLFIAKFTGFYKSCPHSDALCTADIGPDVIAYHEQIPRFCRYP